MASRRAQKRAAIAMRRAKGPRPRTRRPLDRGVRHLELMPHPPSAREVELHMVVCVIADQMARGCAACELRKTPHMISNHKEGRRYALNGERLKYAISRPLVRPVVEREIDAPPPGATLDGGTEEQTHPHHRVTRL